MGKPLIEAIPEIHDQTFLGLLSRVFETGETYVGREVVVRHAQVTDGPIEERIYGFNFVRTNDPQGRPYGVYVHATEVTDKTLARKALGDSAVALKDEQEKFKAIFYSMAAPMALFSGPNFIFEMINSSYQDLAPQRELLRKPLLEALPEVATSPFPDLIKYVYETGKPKAVLGTMTPVHNSLKGLTEERYFDVTYARIELGKDKPFGIFNYAAEVTDRVLASKGLEQSREKLAQALVREKEARAEAEKGNQAKDVFLATLSHELRTPIYGTIEHTYFWNDGSTNFYIFCYQSPPRE